jgi:tetratricopeptide (TPR) repeat protein
VALFVDQAQCVRPHFQLTRGNAGAVAELCRRLEGIPLAIELASVRTRELSPARMLGQIGRRLDLLVSRRRDLPSRHQTLRAALDWSYQLLVPELQRFFARLFPFRDGFTTEAAAIVTAEPLSHRYLEQLRDCSLLLVGTEEQEPRYRLLETLREFAAEHLLPGQRAEITWRHAQYYLSVAEAAAPGLAGGPQERVWLDRLASEHENMRAALEYAQQTDKIEFGLSLALSLDRFWGIRGYLAEARELLCGLLGRGETAAPAALRARALHRAAWFAGRQGDFSAARRLCEDCLTLWRRLGDRSGIAVTLQLMGNLVQYEGDYEAACRYLEESLVICRDLQNRREIAASLGGLGLTLVYAGDYTRACRLLEEGVALFQELGSLVGVAACLNNLGLAILRQGHLPEAQSHFIQSLRLKAELKNTDGVPYGLEGLAELASARGEWERVVRLFAGADAAREAVGHPYCPPSECGNCERLLASARTALGDEAFARIWAESQAWSVDRLLAYATGEVERLVD